MNLMLCAVSRPPRHLYSFPTPRSSDLLAAGAARVAVHQEVVFHLDRLLAHIRRKGAKAGVAVRSEEHTSELQSLRHLVCRLLLEKKKVSVYTGTSITYVPDSTSTRRTS